MPVKGGIGAAINEFETNPIDAIFSLQPIPPRRNESFAVSRLKKSMIASSSNNIRSSLGFSRPSSLAYTLDENDEAVGLGLSVPRHTLPALSTSSNPRMFIPMNVLDDGNQVRLFANAS